jgi:hypothetical protein
MNKPIPSKHLSERMQAAIDKRAANNKNHPFRKQNSQLKDYTLKSMRRKELEKKKEQNG